MAWPSPALYRDSAMTDVPDISLASVRAAAAAIGAAVERTPFRKSITGQLTGKGLSQFSSTPRYDHPTWRMFQQ